MSDSEDPNLTVLKEILKWIKFSAKPQVKTILVEALDNEQKKIAYQLSDGTKGIVEIGKLTGIKSTATISNYWKAWERQNLGQKIPVVGGERFKRDFDLEEFGITVNSSQIIKNNAKGITQQ